MGTQVKLYIEADQETIRRFNIDTNTTYEQLRQRVETLVGHANFRILWLDTERDFIVLGSTDELAAAKAESDGNLLRLFVRPTTNKSACADKKRIHDGVTCDGCQGIIAGTRHKCLECADYDLCEACQGNGTHPEHDMLVIRRPRSTEWKKLFVKGYGTREGAKSNEQEACGFSRRPCGGSARAAGPFQRGSGPVCRGGPFNGPFGGAVRGPFCGPFGRFGGPAFPSGFVPPMCRPFFHRYPDCKPSDKPVEVERDQSSQIAKLLSEVSQKVMDAVYKMQTESTPTGQQENQAPKSDEKTEKEQVEAVTETVTMVKDAVDEPLEDGSKADSDNEWTHVEAEEQNTLDQDEKTVKDQRIESALRAMEQMGFSTEGILLRRLLENYNGDIARVLDSIK